MADQIIDIIQTGVPGPPVDAGIDLIAAARARADEVAGPAAQQAAQSAVAAQNIPGQIANAITAEDIPGQVHTQTTQQVPGLVAQAIAEDDTVVQAAADAIIAAGAAGGLRPQGVATSSGPPFLSLTTGTYQVRTAGDATALGLPIAAHGVLDVNRWAANNGVGVVTFTTRQSPPRIWHFITNSDGTNSGWLRGADVGSTRAQGVAWDGGPEFEDLPTGTYQVRTATDAIALGLPAETHGVLEIDKWTSRGEPTGLARFITRTAPSEEWRYVWQPPSGGSPRWEQWPPQREPVTERIEWAATMQSGHGWATTESPAATIVADTAEYRMGTQSLRINGVEGQRDTIISPPLNIDLTDRALVVWLRCNYGAPDGLWVRAGDIAGGNYYQWRVIRPGHTAGIARYGEWVQLRLLPQNFTGSPDITNLERVSISSDDTASVSWNLQGVGTAETETQPRGIVSLTFDDGEAGVLRAAREYMTPRGWAGTAYVIRSKSSGGNPRYLGEDDITELYEDHGWTIGVHNLTPYTDMTPAQLEQSWTDDADWFNSMGLPAARHMAWVRGRVDAERARVARKFFDTARTIYVGTETRPVGDPFRLMAISSITDATVDDAKAWIDRAFRWGGWINLVFHKLNEVADPEDTSDISFTAFAEILDHIEFRGLDVKTHDELFNPKPR